MPPFPAPQRGTARRRRRQHGALDGRAQPAHPTPRPARVSVCHQHRGRDYAGAGRGEEKNNKNITYANNTSH